MVRSRACLYQEMVLALKPAQARVRMLFEGTQESVFGVFGVLETKLWLSIKITYNRRSRSINWGAKCWETPGMQTWRRVGWLQGNSRLLTPIPLLKTWLLKRACSPEKAQKYIWRNPGASLSIHQSLSCLWIHPFLCRSNPTVCRRATVGQRDKRRTAA